MVLLNQMIKTGRLYEFIGTIIRIRNDEQEGQVMWEFWLHREFERSFSEFCAQAANTEKSETAGKRELAEIVKQSMQIASFAPQGTPSP